MDRRTFIGGVVALPFAFLFKKAKAEEIVEQSIHLEKTESVEVKEKSNCVEDKYGTKRWQNQNGERHRLDGPAVEWTDGSEWFQNDKRHRLDGPAVEWDGGYKAWYQNGKLCRYVNG